MHIGLWHCMIVVCVGASYIIWSAAKSTSSTVTIPPESDLDNVNDDHDRQLAVPLLHALPQRYRELEG